MNTPATLPSKLLERAIPLIKPQGNVLDLACGYGRNGLYLLQQGFKLSFLDKDHGALNSIAQQSPQSTLIHGDLESSNPYLIAPNSFDAILVFRYLHRPIMPMLVAALKPGGILVYETFTAQQSTIGRPKNPDFLLQDDELLKQFEQLNVHHHQQGFNHEQQSYIAQFIGQLVEGRSSTGT